MKSLIHSWLRALPLLALAPLSSTSLAQNDTPFELPNVATNGFVAFAERYANYAPGASDGDVVTLINTTTAAGVTPGTAILGPGLPNNPTGVTQDGNTLHWKLGGQLAGNEQIRRRQTPLEAPLTTFDDLAGNGRFQVIVPTLSSPATGSTPLVEILTISAAGSVPTVLLLPLAVAEPGPYPPLVVRNQNRAYISVYDDSPNTTNNPVSVYAIDLGNAVTPPTVIGGFTPAIGQNQVAASAGYMRLDPGTARLQLPVQNGVHSIDWSTPAAPTALFFGVTGARTLGSDIRFTVYDGQAQAMFCTRGGPFLTSQAVFYNPGGSPIPPTEVDFGNPVGSTRPWRLAAGFHTPARSERNQNGVLRDIFSIPVVGATGTVYSPFGGPGALIQVQRGPVGTITFTTRLGATPFGEPTPARNQAGDPIAVCATSGAIDYIQTVGTGSVFGLTGTNGRVQLNNGTGTYGPAVIGAPLALPGGNEFAVFGDFANGPLTNIGVEVFGVASGQLNAAAAFSSSVHVTNGGQSTSHTVPYLNGPLGNQPIYLHGFSGAQSVGVRPPLLNPPVFLPMAPTVGGPGNSLGALVNAGGFFVPQIAKNVNINNAGPRRPVFAHDGALLNAVFCDTLGPVAAPLSRLTVQFGNGGAVATYNPGSIFLTELLTF